MELEERKLKEIEHTDRRRQIVRAFEYQTDSAEDFRQTHFVTDREAFEKHFSNMKFYSISRSSFAYRDKLLFDGIEGCTTLDYCCGNGEIGIEMARSGAAQVYGIDISQVAVDNANQLAEANHLSHQCQFKIMDAEHTEFDNDTFDIIHEYGALHHLDLEAAFKEMSRILKPNGKIVCTEALRHNPAIHLYRKMTPNLRTGWEVEHILGAPEIMKGLDYFKNIHIRFFHLFALAAVPLRKTSIFDKYLTWLEKIDDHILKIPYIQRMAWVAVFTYSNPKRKNSNRLT